MNRLALAALLLVLPTLPACQDLSETDNVSQNPAGLFWDSRWSLQGTFVEREGLEVTPYPTDYALLEQIRYGQDGGPPISDVLEGTLLTFEIDGRILAQPAGADTPEYLETDYRVPASNFLYASVRKSAWFPASYFFDAASQTLLLQADAEGAEETQRFVIDIVERALFAGAVDSAAARISSVLFGDPRIEPALDSFVFDLLHGTLETVPIRGPDDVSAYLIVLLRQTGVVDASVDDSALNDTLEPIVAELLPHDEAGITRLLLAQLLESELTTLVVSADRAERVLTFSLYRRMLEAYGRLSDVARIDLLLERTP